MRIFSGSKASEFGPPPPKLFVQEDTSSTGSASPKSSQSSLAHAFSPKFRSNSSSPRLMTSVPEENSLVDNVPPELVPIVTLLSAHAHRRYCEGVFLILEDLRNDGNPGERKWQEVYGMLVGTQLALWDANELAACNKTESKYKLKEVVSKPRYINFADAAVKLLDGSEAIITESNKKLDNIAVVSTTLKNRHFLQFSDKEAFIRWNAAIQLSIFECTSLQEAYTGAFLSSRGAQLGDIKTLLDSRFKYEGWGSVRFGTGMPWKRCFVIITQSSGRKKNASGQITFFENEKKTKKSQSIATVVGCKRLYAVYPSSPQLIDSSTIIKLEGSMKFSKKDPPQETSFFIMPEKHQAVPGYDTTIRFLVPAMNAFKLYGRPKKLAASKDDPNSLLFGLPTLPHVHYLKVEELLPLSSSPTSVSWTFHDWSSNIKEVLLSKMANGYTGCGSSPGIMGAMVSPTLDSAQMFNSSSLIPEPKPERAEKRNTATISPDHNTCHFRSIEDNAIFNKPSKSDNLLQVGNKKKNDFETTTSIYSGDENLDRGNKNVEEMSRDNKALPFAQSTAEDGEKAIEDRLHNPSRNPTSASHRELDNLYHKYSMSPFGRNDRSNTSGQFGGHQSNNPYIDHKNAERGMKEMVANTVNGDKENEIFDNGDYASSNEERDEEQDALREFNDLAKRINELNIGAIPGPERKIPEGKVSPWGTESSSTDVTHDDDDNVFDPDFMERNGMLEAHSRHTGEESFSDTSPDDPFNGISARGLEIETPPHKTIEPRLDTQINYAVHAEPNVPPVEAMNPYVQKPKAAPVLKPPYDQRQPPPNSYAYQPMMKQAGGFPPYNFPPHNFPPHNFPPQPSHHRQYQRGHPYRPHPHGSPQPYAANSAPNRGYMNAHPQQRMHPGTMAPNPQNPQLHIYGRRAGPYPPPGHYPRQQAPVRLKQPMGGGHTKFPSPTTVNPYAK